MIPVSGESQCQFQINISTVYLYTLDDACCYQILPQTGFYVIFQLCFYVFSRDASHSLILPHFLLDILTEDDSTLFTPLASP